MYFNFRRFTELAIVVPQLVVDSLASAHSDSSFEERENETHFGLFGTDSH
jgi:hypothetical protein